MSDQRSLNIHAVAVNRAVVAGVIYNAIIPVGRTDGNRWNNGGITLNDAPTRLSSTVHPAATVIDGSTVPVRAGLVVSSVSQCSVNRHLPCTATSAQSNDVTLSVASGDDVNRLRALTEAMET